MTPNFALALSFDGIRLLQRVADGWLLVGDVSLDTDDLTGEMADLRRKALTLDTSGLRTKLLIPNDQIKYTAIDSTQTDEADIRAAIDGSTPYAFDDLVVDHERSGGRTHIAAVARETLEEAEAFATEHEFAPVCFAAVAEPLTFQTEVFFGVTKAAGRAEVSRDPAPVAVTGTAKLPETPDAVAPSFLRSGSAKLDESKSLNGKANGADAPDSATPDPGDAELPAFQSRSKSLGSPKQAELAATSAPQKAAPQVPAASEASEIPAPEVEPLFTRRKVPPAPAKPIETSPAAPSLAAPAVEAPVVSAAAPPVALAVAAAPDAVAKPVEAPATPPQQTRPEPASRKAARRKQRAETQRTDRPKVGGKPRFLGLILTAILLVFLALVGAFAATQSEDGLAGFFGFGGPDSPAVAETDPNVVPVSIPSIDPVEEVNLAETEVAPTPLDTDEADGAANRASVETAPTTPEALPLPIVRAPEARILSPAEAERIYAATGVWQRAPRLPLDPRQTSLDGFLTPIALETQTTTTALALPDAEEMFPDATLRPQPNPPAFGTVYPRDLRGFILATPEGTITPDGVLIFAGRPDILPSPRPGSVSETGSPDDVASAVNPAFLTETGVILIPGPPPISPRARPASVEARAAALVTAPDEATEPEAEPPLASLDLADVETAPTGTAQINAAPETTEIALPALASYSGTRPLLRPTRLEPVAVDPAVAAARPALRPTGLAPETELANVEALQVPEDEIDAELAALAAADADLSAIQGGLAETIRPNTRPRNFSRVVANAQALLERQQSRDAAARASATAVAAAPTTRAATPTSVTRAATIDNAISLRSLNLIGVYGRPNDRRALVRLANGRFIKVEVGSSLDGGQVTAISDRALNYVKRGRTYALEIPSG